MIEFFMPLIPPTTTHQQKQVTVRNGKPVFYEPDDLKAARSKLMGQLGRHAPKSKYTDPVRLITKWLFPMTKTSKNGQYKHTRPDTDNLQKLLKDCMSDCGYWTDDALVVSEVSEKFWADTPGIYIKIEEV